MILTILVVASSCAMPEKQTRTPEEILNSAMGGGAMAPGKVSTLPGADRSDLPYIPVITPPQIARVWIYDHVTPSNDLVVGHWVFIKLKDERWYIEDQWEDRTPRPVHNKMPVPPGEGGQPEEKQLSEQPAAALAPNPAGQLPGLLPGITPIPPQAK